MRTRVTNAQKNQEMPQKPEQESASEIPESVKVIAERLIESGKSAYLVGGCVRDLILRREPKDWDIATDAHPEEGVRLFPESVYENDFGTVAVKTEPLIGQGEKGIVEVTTMRQEGRYTVKRHPDNITFAKTIEADLSRRDFTVNAMAYKLGTGKSGRNFAASESLLVDPYGGERDLAGKVIRAVGNPAERFNEDALRLMRAVRFAAELGFTVEEKTGEALKKESGLLEMIAKERVRDELGKILMAGRAASGIQMLESVGLLRFIMPELREGLGVGQNKHHIYSVWEHNLRALDYTVGKKYPLLIRMAALLHDVGKPRAKRGEGPDSTFYQHDKIGARMVIKMMDRLRFSKDLTEQVAHLVNYHMFFYNMGEVTEAGVRRFLRRVGPENIDDLMKVREADRIGSGVPKAVTYRMRHLRYMIEKVKRDPISAKMLKVNGEDVMRLADLKPGPKVGFILAALLEGVLDDPKKNSEEQLARRMSELVKLPESELKAMAAKARERKEEFEAGEDEEIKKQFYVQ